VNFAKWFIMKIICKSTERDKAFFCKVFNLRAIFVKIQYKSVLWGKKLPCWTLERCFLSPRSRLTGQGIISLEESCELPKTGARYAGTIAHASLSSSAVGTKRGPLPRHSRRPGHGDSPGLTWLLDFRNKNVFWVVFLFFFSCEGSMNAHVVFIKCSSHTAVLHDGDVNPICRD
jgi:hypothetical protein